MTWMFLNGDGMRGGALHHQLGDAPLVAATSTAPRYRFFSVRDAFPALREADEGETGVAVRGEVYDVPLLVLRDGLLPAEPAELELGVIELADGTASLAMLLRRPWRPVGAGLAAAELTDISELADWARYRAGNDAGGGNR